MQLLYNSGMHIVSINLHEVFQALSDPYRVRVIRLMRKVRGELCLCELSEALDEPEYKLSRHIKILKSHGLLTSVRDGKWIYHSLVADQKFLKSIFKALDEFPDKGHQTLLDLKRFKNRLKLRDKGRCKVSSRVIVSPETRVKA